MSLGSYKGRRAGGNGVGQGGRSEMQSRAEDHSKQSKNNFITNTSKWPAPPPLSMDVGLSQGILLIGELLQPPGSQETQRNSALQMELLAAALESLLC